MEFRQRIGYLREEQEVLLNLAARIEKLLESASSNDFSERVKSLLELRSLEPRLAGIVEHCHAGRRLVESVDVSHLQPEERARIEAEHEQIIRVVDNFREELKCTTVDRTMAMILPGMDVVKWLRAHVAYERELLGRTAELERHRKKTAGKKKTVKTGHEKKSRHIAKQKTSEKAADILPYTLESHPELRRRTF
jgi:hypothetical protein